MLQQVSVVHSTNGTIHPIAYMSHVNGLEVREANEDAFNQPSHEVLKHPLRQSPSDIVAAINESVLRHLTNSDLLSMSAKLLAEVQERCQGDLQTMLPSFINRLPTHKESGTFLCLDVGGSTLRAALVRLNQSQSTPELIAMRTAPITPDLKTTDGANFFRWIAKIVTPLVNELGISTQGHTSDLKTALTWSFPFTQQAINRATIVACGKGFRTFDELVGQNLDSVLRDAFLEESIKISIEAMVNDTVASLLAGNHSEPLMTLSVILGTGLNAAAAIPTSAIGPSKLSAQILKSIPTEGFTAGHVLVNTELSVLGDDIFPKTYWDHAVRESITSGVIAQPLEYMCGGYYIGEIVRVILVWSHKAGFLLPQPIFEQLTEPFSLDAATLAIIDSDSTCDLCVSAETLKKDYKLLEIDCPTFEQLSMMKAVTQAVSRRAAGYLAVAIHAMAGLACQKAESNNTFVVGVSGAMFEKYPGFTAKCEDILNSMTMAAEKVDKGSGSDRPGHFVLKQVAHGSVIGSAIAAALSSS